MTHRGELVDKIVRQKKYSYVQLSELTGISRTTLYKVLARPDMPIQYILKIGEVINVDFTKIIPGLNKEIVDTEGKEYRSMEHIVEEAQEAYMPMTYAELDINIHLDGTDGTLDKIINKLKKVNEALKLV